jgi:protein AbiQ
MKFYTVSDEYITYLRTIDGNVPHNYSSGRAFIGVVLTISEHKYLAPLTSYKPKQDNYDSSSPTLFKLHERTDPLNKLGMIQLNNMIPVLDSEISLLDIESQRLNYKRMLYKQYEFIKINAHEIQKRAEHIYMLVVIKETHFFKRISCNFKLLEDSYQLFHKET